MDELHDRIRAFADESALGDEHRIAEEEVRERVDGRRLGELSLALDRPRGTRRRRALAVAAAAFMLVGAAATVRSMDDQPRTTVTGSSGTTREGPTSTTAPTANVPARVLAEGIGVYSDRALAATTEANMADLWTETGLDGDPPSADFATEVVIAISVAGCSAEPGVESPQVSAQRTGDLVSIFATSSYGPSRENQVCLAMPVPAWLVVALDARATGDRFRYRQDGRDASDGVGPEPTDWMIEVVRPTGTETTIGLGDEPRHTTPPGPTTTALAHDGTCTGSSFPALTSLLPGDGLTGQSQAGLTTIKISVPPSEADITADRSWMTIELRPAASLREELPAVQVMTSTGAAVTAASSQEDVVEGNQDHTLRQLNWTDGPNQILVQGFNLDVDQMLDRLRHFEVVNRTTFIEFTEDHGIGSVCTR